MAITSQDIQEEGFEHSLRGYDVEQVDVFLERVAQEVDVMNRTIEQLNLQLANASAKPAVSSDALDAANARADIALADAKQAKAALAEATARAEETERKLNAALKRADAAERQLAPLQAELEEKTEMDRSISQAFISAQRSADALKEEARAEGERIYREAEGKAREFIREALAKKAAIYNEIDALQQSADSFRESYVAMVDDFAVQAKEKFANMEPPSIPDGIVNDMLPDIESLTPAEQPEQAEADDEEEKANPLSNIPAI